jgi:hypothetical protein
LAQEILLFIPHEERVFMYDLRNTGLIVVEPADSFVSLSFVLALYSFSPKATASSVVESAAEEVEA